MKPKDITRFFKKVEKTSSCWIWTASKQKGYGAFHLDGKMKPAHRVLYEHIYGEIKSGYEIDHLCFDKSCVNPMHLDMVTPSTNTRRAKKHLNQVAYTYQPKLGEKCKNGHPRTIENTYEYKKKKSCRVCQNNRVKKYQLMNKNAVSLRKKQYRTRIGG